MKSPLRFSLVFLLSLAPLLAGCGSKDGNGAGGSTATSQHIPDGAFAVIAVHPNRVLKSKTLEPLKLGEMLPPDLPFDPYTVEEVMMVVLPKQDSNGDEPLGVIARFSKPYDKQKVLGSGPFQGMQSVDHNGKTYYARSGSDEADTVAFPNDRIILISPSRSIMHAMLSSSGSSPLIESLAQVDANSDAFVVLKMEPVRELLRQQMQQAGEDTDESFKKVPDQIDTITATAKLDPSPKLDVVIKATSGAAANELKTAIAKGKAEALENVGMATGQVEQMTDAETADQAAQALEEMLNSIEPTVVGDELKFSVSAPAGTNELIAKVGEVLEQLRQMGTQFEEMPQGEFEGQFEGFDEGEEFKDASNFEAPGDGFEDFPSDQE